MAMRMKLVSLADYDIIKQLKGNTSNYKNLDSVKSILDTKHLADDIKAAL
jgi:hypothetical protein